MITIERKYIELLAVAVGGAAIGAIATRYFLEGKIREDLAFQVETLENTYEAAIALRDAKDRLKEDIQAELDQAVLNGDGLVKVEDGHIVPLNGRIGEVTEVRDVEGGVEMDVVMDQPIVDVDAPDYIGSINTTVPSQEPVKNQYHQALEAKETPVEMFVDGGVNDYGVSYIEEDDYLDEDGRFKGKIDILLDDGDPIFIQDGAQIDDWDRKIGDSILVDMFRLCPPGIDPILYVRNHRTDEDYEVVRVEP